MRESTRYVEGEDFEPNMDATEEAWRGTANANEFPEEAQDVVIEAWKQGAVLLITEV